MAEDGTAAANISINSFFDRVNFNYLFISSHTSAWEIIKVPVDDRRS